MRSFIFDMDSDVGCRFDFAQEAELAQADVVIEDLRELMVLWPAMDLNK